MRSSISGESCSFSAKNSRIKQNDHANVLDKNPEQRFTYYCAIQGSRTVNDFEFLNKIEEGTYGVVFRARDKMTHEIVALKKLKIEKEKEGFPITSIREVDTLIKAQHPNVVTLREIVVGNDMNQIFMVMDFVEHDLKGIMKSMKKPFMMAEVKSLMLQLLRGVEYLHENWIIHRDLKTSNLLLSDKGVLKIADFGLAREYGSPLKEYTPVVVTLWYRSPELLLGVKKYSTSIDMWSVGCIFGELMLLKPLFSGQNELDQLNKIFKDLGTPTEQIWPDWKELPLAKNINFPTYPYNTLKSRFGKYLSEKGFDLINKLLRYDPNRRLTAEDSLKHEFFQENPLPLSDQLILSVLHKSGDIKFKLKEDKDDRPRGFFDEVSQQLAGEEEGFMLKIPIETGFSLKDKK